MSTLRRLYIKLALAVPIVKRLTSVIQTLTVTARDAAQALSEVFGINMDSAESTADMSVSSGEAAENYEVIAEAAEEAADANERSLMSFDQINKIDGGESPAAETEVSGAGEALSPVLDIQTDKAESKLTAFFDGVKKGFEAAFKPFRSAWDTYGEPFVSSAETAFESLKGLFSDVSRSFAEVWTNGTGEEILGHHIGIIQDLISLVGNPAESFRTAWNTDDLGTDIVQGVADILNTVSAHAETFTGILSGWAAQVDLTPLLTSFKDLETALEPFADTVGDGLEWLLENVLLPLADWTLEEAVPAAIDVFSAALDVLTASAKALKKPAKWLWNKFLKPLSEWAGEIITSGLEALSDILNDLGDWIDKNPDSAAFFMGLTTAVLGLNAAAKAGGIAALAGKLGTVTGSLASLNVTVGVIIAGIAGWTYAITEISSNWDEIAEVVEQDGGIFGFISGWIESCTEDIEEFFSFGKFGELWLNMWEGFGESVADLTGGWDTFFEGVGEKIFDFLNPIPDDFSESFGAAEANVELVFSGIGDWFGDRRADIEKAFRDIGSWFGRVFRNAWSGITQAFSKVRYWFTARRNDIQAVFQNIASWFGQRFTAAWGNIKSAFANVKSWFTARWSDITGIFGGAADWFKGKFSAAWENIKSSFSGVGEFFSGVWDSIGSGLKSSVNWVIGCFNHLIDGINKVSVTMPDWDWLPDGMSGVSFGFSVPRIPELAKGTVVPANYGEFLAILGDNKRETEVVSPLSTIEEAVMSAMVKLGIQGGAGHKTPLQINVMLDRKTISKAVIDDINDRTRRNGRSPLTGGQGV